MQIRSPFTKLPTLFIYENQPGGVGMAPRLYEVHSKLLRAARDLTLKCPCGEGCPGCVGPNIGATPTNKRAALEILERLIGPGLRDGVRDGPS